MYLSHFGLTEPPFRITPHTDFFFEGANRGATLEALLYAVLHDEGIVKVSGEVGSGKTMLCRVLLERLPKNVDTIYLATPSLNRDEILRAIAEDLHVDVRGKRTTLLLRALQDHLIQRYAQGHRVVVLIDEAHAMPPETLEEIRLLSNLESNRHKLLQIVLFGQPELDDHLNVPTMRQLKERITHSFRLEPLVRRDIESYIDFRMRAAGYKGRNAFSAAALRAIASASEGLTRRINILADKALLAAFVDSSHEVTAKHAQAAVKDSEYRRMRPTRWSPVAISAAGLAAGALLVLATQHMMGPQEPTAPTAPPAAQRAPVHVPQPAPQGSAVNGASPAAPAPAESNPEVPVAVGPRPVPSQASAQQTPAPTSTASATVVAASPVVAASHPVGDTPAAPVASSANESPAASSARADTLPEPARAAGGDAAGGAQKRIPAQGRLVRDRFLAAQSWLASTPPDRYSIQLLTASETDLVWMENFLQRATELVGADQLYVYSWKSNGRQNYRVALGTFASPQDAAAALVQVPAPLKAFKPYPESLGIIRRLNAEGS